MRMLRRHLMCDQDRLAVSLATESPGPSSMSDCAIIETDGMDIGESANAAQATTAKASGAAARPLAQLADRASAEGAAGTASETPATATVGGATAADLGPAGDGGAAGILRVFRKPPRNLASWHKSFQGLGGDQTGVQ